MKYRYDDTGNAYNKRNYSNPPCSLFILELSIVIRVFSSESSLKILFHSIVCFCSFSRMALFIAAVDSASLSDGCQFKLQVGCRDVAMIEKQV